jgi:hypothetical protein
MLQINNKKLKEDHEKVISDLFLEIYNNKYKTDYKTGPAEKQNSLIDRRGISRSGKLPELKLQIKEVKEWDKEFVSSLRNNLPKKNHKEVKGFNVSIFEILKDLIIGIESNYKDKVKEINLVLVVYASPVCIEDWISENVNVIEYDFFKDIFLLTLPTTRYGASIFKV